MEIHHVVKHRPGEYDLFVPFFDRGNELYARPFFRLQLFLYFFDSHYSKFHLDEFMC